MFNEFVIYSQLLIFKSKLTSNKWNICTKPSLKFICELINNKYGCKHNKADYFRLMDLNCILLR